MRRKVIFWMFIMSILFIFEDKKSNDILTSYYLY
ncbi:hypothetical protein AF74_00975 [Aliarcobacter butzleri L349]|nr:hypothetical protein AF74_00975 [Aliarcobacter butzleri L349]